MTALEEVAELKQKAVDILLAERERIDRELSVLQENAPTKRRGRRPKNQEPVSHSETTGERSSSPLSSLV